MNVVWLSSPKLYCPLDVYKAELWARGPCFHPDQVLLTQNMASCTRALLRVLSRGQLLTPTNLGVCHLATRSYAAPARAQKKKVKQKDEEKAVKKERKPVDNTGRHKPFGLTSWAPVDDVYVARYYPRPVFPAVDAILKLKRNQQLDATPLDQLVYLDLKLDMTLEKKKKVESFVSTVQLPHPLTGHNTVVVFTEDPEQARIAWEHGAQFVGGPELVDKILDDKLSADFYISVPEMLEKLFPLKNKLRKQFPKNKRGSVGVNIPKMLSMFKTGFQYMVENECYIKTQIATLDMPTESILANMQTIVTDVCSHRPAEHGPFIERAIVASHTSEALRFNSQDLLPPPSLEEES